MPTSDVTPDMGQRPQSVTSLWLTLTGATCGIAMMICLSIWQTVSVAAAMTLCAIAIALPIAIGDLLIYRVYRRPSTGLGPRRNEGRATGRVFTKLVGLWGTYGAIGFVYWLLPEYHGTFFTPFFSLLKHFMPWVFAFSIPYFFLVDRRMTRPHDAYWHLGRILIGHWIITSETRRTLHGHALAWTIKAFFIPLMSVFLYHNLGWLMRHPPALAFENMMTTIYWFINVGFFLDVAFAFIGYILTMRVLDSHIRSANPLVLGWAVALVCYPPFWALIKDHYLIYGNSPNWVSWLEGHPVLLAAWGVMLIALVIPYALATVIFGLRFSNLTHRGIITNGPFRFTKHPAYLSKNIYWWLVAVPFITDMGWQNAVQSCMLLALVNMIYFLRARTEERHLMSDPVYAAYSRWIDRHGLFARIKPVRIRPGRHKPLITSETKFDC